MALITVGATPQFDEGTYVGELSAIEQKTIEPKKGQQAGQKVDIFEWRFGLSHMADDAEANIKAGDPVVDFDTGEPIVGRATSSTATGPRSKLSKFLVALLGPSAVEPGAEFEAEDLVGKKALVTLVKDEGGYPKVEELTALPRGNRRSVREQAAPAAEAPKPAPAAEAEAEDDDLPF